MIFFTSMTLNINGICANQNPLFPISIPRLKPLYQKEERRFAVCLLKYYFLKTSNEVMKQRKQV